MVRDDPLEGLAGVKLGAGVANEIKSNAAKAAVARVRTGDKSDRATVEQAIDPRTRMVSDGDQACAAMAYNSAGSCDVTLASNCWEDRLPRGE